MLYLVGIIISFFLFFLLIGKKNKDIADVILAIWLFVMGFHLYFYYSSYPSHDIQNIVLYRFFFGLPFLYGPLLYLYSKYRIDSTLKFKKIDLIHFIPITLIYILIVPDFSISLIDQNLQYENGILPCYIMDKIVFILILISGVGYALSSLVLLKNYKKNIDSYFSNTEKINLNWLRLNIYGIIAVWLILANRNDCYTFTFISLFVFSIGYFGIKQVGVFNDNYSFENSSSGIIVSENSTYNETEIKTSEQKATPVKYQKSALSQDDGIRIQEELRTIMQTEKLYLNPELTLGDVAKKLDIHPNILSQVINTFEQKTFYDYINSLRIEAFKEAIAIEDNQKFTLFSLAFECGFNSKSSFNKHFKKVTNQTPSEYLNSVKES